MKKFLQALAVSAAALLGGCEQVTTEQVQAATAQICGFVPTAIIVAGFIPQAAPFAAGASGIATAICDALAVQQQTLGRRRGAAQVNVIVALPNGTQARVVGHYVR